MKKIIFSCFLLLFVLACSEQDVPSSGDPTVDLFKAVSTGNVTAIKKAIARGANINATCKINADTNECFWKGYKNECLGQEDMDFQLDSTDYEEYYTPLFIAAKMKQPKIVLALLNEGANIKLPSRACRISCDGECHPYSQEILAHSEFFFSDPDSTTDVTLQTALIFAQKGAFEKIYNASFLISNEKISDRVLSDFLKQMSQLNAIEGINSVDIVDDKAMTLLDQAYSKNRPLTAKLLKSIGVKRVSHSEAVEGCGSDNDNEFYEECSGAVWKVRYDDGSEENVNKCECEVGT